MLRRITNHWRRDHEATTRQARGLLQIAIAAMGRRIAGDGRANAVCRTDTALDERMVKHVYGNSGRTGSLVEETGSKAAHAGGGPEIHAKSRWLEAAPGLRAPGGHGVFA